MTSLNISKQIPISLLRSLRTNCGKLNFLQFLPLNLFLHFAIWSSYGGLKQNFDFRNSSLKPVPVHTKTQSLPNRSCHSNYSCAVFDILRIAPEDFATQLTILDWPVFSSIQPDELTSCGWNKKNKLNVAPNVVTFSRRFNHVMLNEF